jgi:hypothetical protein
VDNVVAAIDEQRSAMAERLVSLATSKGLSEEEAKQALTEVGLLDRPVAVTAPSTPEGDDGTLARLLAFARSHGFTG